MTARPGGEGPPPFVDAATLRRLVSPRAAVDALEAVLASGQAPGRTPPRTAIEAEHGQVLLMPSEIGGWWGIKTVSIAPQNPAAGHPRIQGVYLLMDSATLTPQVLVDAVALTNLRTPAVSALALRYLRPGPVSRLLLYGSGPQALGHLEAVLAAGPVEQLTMVCRDLDRGAAALQRFRVGQPVELGACRVLSPADPAVPAALGEAQVVVCATTAREPLFDSSLLRPDACVIAVGSHEPTAREVDSALVARATVVVESRETAWREAGDLIIPRRAGELSDDVPAGELADLVAGRVPQHPGRPRFFKSVGEAWQDLVVASLAAQLFLAEQRATSG